MSNGFDWKRPAAPAEARMAEVLGELSSVAAILRAALPDAPVDASVEALARLVMGFSQRRTDVAIPTVDTQADEVSVCPWCQRHQEPRALALGEGPNCLL